MTAARGVGSKTPTDFHFTTETSQEGILERSPTAQLGELRDKTQKTKQRGNFNLKEHL